MQAGLAMEQDSTRNAAKVGGRVAGGAAVAGFIYSMVRTQGDFTNSLAYGLVAAFLGYIAGAIGSVIYENAKDGAGRHQNPLMQGLVFVAIIAGGIGFVDFALLGGTYIVLPAISLLFDQSLEGTYWTCKDWVTADEGSFCGSQ
jgi:hypothetical protein